MNYNKAKLCKDCKQPVEKYNIPRPTLDYKSNRGQYMDAWRKIVDKVLRQIKHKEWQSTGEDLYELFANGKRYRSDDPAKVVTQAMTDRGWEDMLRRGVEHRGIR